MQDTETPAVEAAQEPVTDPPVSTDEAIPAEELLAPEPEPAHEATSDLIRLKAIIEAIVYLTDQPLSIEQIAGALEQKPEVIAQLLSELTDEFEKPEHGVAIREVAGGFSMATKPEHHEEVRAFVKNLQPAMKLSLASLETLAVIAYRQPITAPEIMEIRGVQGASVLKTLLDRKLIAAAGRKNVIGKPILYKTTKEFLVQFGLKDLAELPSLKEFDEIRRLAVSDDPESPRPPEEPAPDVLPVEPNPEIEPANPSPEEPSPDPDPFPEANPLNGN
jgi:segregation and condensation protein B